MKAIIMAGGEGSRLRPLTCDLPKPMVPVMNRPIMEHIIELLKAHGITEIGVTLMYLPQKIRDYFGNGSNFGVNLYYFIEDTPLGTAGSVKNAGDFLDETFIVISGDALTDMDLTKAVEFHRKKKAKATLVLAKVEIPLEYGVVITDENGLIVRFLEKPGWGEVFSDTVNTGTYILEPEVLNHFEKGRKFDFSQDLFPILLKNKEPMYGHITDRYWCDIGDLKAYLQAHYDVFDGKIKLNIEGTEIRDRVWIGNGTTIDPKAVIEAPAVIGSNCKIGPGTSIENYSVIGDDTVIENDVSLRKSVVWNNSFIEYGSELRGAILCDKVHLKYYTSVFENAIIGERTVVNERAIIKPNVKIWPQKVIDPFAIIDRNIIWGVRHSKTIFGEKGLSGIINIDISPEFATRLGAAYGSIFKKGSKVVVSSTPANSARMFKHAFISGILSVGVEVFNMSGLFTPTARYAIPFLAADGGIHIKLSNDNPDKLQVDFMDHKGAGISRATERKIESAFIREDFKRCSGEEISRLNNFADFNNYYARMILNDIDCDDVRKKQPKVLFVSPSNSVITLVTSMLNDMGCKVISQVVKSFESGVEDIKDEVKKNNADFAAYINNNAENLCLVDKSGKVISEDFFTVLTSLITFRSVKGARVVVPVTAPSVIEKLAKKYGGTVVRTKTSQRAVMEEMLDGVVIKDRESLNQFLLNFDAIAGLMRIIEFLCVNNTSLTNVLKQIPKFNVCRKKIYCPWEMKGKVMRTLITEKSGEKAELLDGVKFIFDDGWALILPDADMPFCKIYSEGKTAQAAEEICERYLRRIGKIIGI